MALVLATPHPDLDIHALFSYYNSIYFDNTLSSCFVEWSSPRMTSCLATCNYLKGSCQITLSKPLLQCLSSDHVKNTLLHEMIHAYLFVTKNYRHHGSHGPDFRHIMDSINFSTNADNQRPPFGYKITLFHDFHDEDIVDDEFAYIWMCKKCGNTIKRATATQPSYADCITQAHHNKKTCGLANCRWHRHKVECGGIYTKIQKLEVHHDKKKAVSNGSARLLDEESLENIIPEPEKKGKYVATSSRRELFPSSDKVNLSATSDVITYRRSLRGTTRSKLIPSGINIKTDVQGQLIDQKSPEAIMSGKKGKSVTELNKETMRILQSSANSHKISKSRTLSNEVPQAKQEHFSPNVEEPFRTRKLRVQSAKSTDMRGHSSTNVKKRSVENTSEKGKSPQKKAIIEEAALRQAAHAFTCSAKVFPKGKHHQSTSDREASENLKALEKMVTTEVQTIRKSTRFFPSDDKLRTSSMKVALNRKPELSSPNMFESCRKRKRTNKEFISQEYKVVSEWLEYYEDESTDEEIEPLVNRKIIRTKRMKILRESIQREKEENDRKLLEETGRKLLCLPGFSEDKILDISDDNSS